ncbi:MAG TPA: leucine--tRNA ligase [Patescibacteria group bacterium]|nr:leucine--tRNA ligase [Patescibacteria group bacterium]
MSNYNHQQIEKKWQNYWEENDSFLASDFSDKEKKYILVEFPYPSGAGLHVGHVRSYTALDVYARYLRLQGFNVLYPMGYDAFGLPTENYAIKHKIHPSQATKENINTFRSQLKKMGFSFDYSREINTTDPNYYKWTQWIFIQLYKHGLAYKQKMAINWCPSCKTGLANEEVVNGKCERCKTAVEKKEKEQWMLRITKYADRLIDDLDKVDYLDKIKQQQINWIGRSEGAQIDFQIQADTVSVFTTRPDTIFGVSYFVLSPEHPLVNKICTKGRKVDVENYIKEAKNKSDLERVELQKDKTGVFTGAYATNPITKEEIPIWVADYVLMSYGSGAIMAVPAHDSRDLEFAKKYELPIKEVINEEKDELVNSDFLNGLSVKEAQEKIIKILEDKSLGKKAINYKLRDWIFSRQHYWGEPIPIIYCDKCGTVPVPVEDLPLELPKVEKYEPTDTGESPLADISSFVNTTCPKCGAKAKRETDTMPNWAGSSWYWLRYLDPNNNDVLADKEKMKYWLPVDLYNGGMEHTTLHLLYSRFWNKFLYDIKVVPTLEPYQKRISHGMILAEDGRKMSKSFGNTINPDDVIVEYGADTLRMYEMFIGPFSETIPWNTNGLVGVRKFLEKVFDYFDVYIKGGKQENEINNQAKVVLNKTIAKLTHDIKDFKFNTAVSSLMILFNELKIKDKYHLFGFADIKKILIILFPLAPHLSSEMWDKIEAEGKIEEQSWPDFDEKLLKEQKVKIVVQVNGKFRASLELESGLTKDEVINLAKVHDNVSKWLEDKELKKIIYIQDKLINFVI